MNFLKWLIKPFISLWRIRYNYMFGRPKGGRAKVIAKDLYDDINKKPTENIYLW